MVKLVFLNEQFFEDYRDCTEIERKTDRPHVQIYVRIKDFVCCIPMRSNITHEHAIFTVKENRCGIDFTKTVFVSDPDKYIDKTAKPRIRPNEYGILKKVTDYDIQKGLAAYIKAYKKAKERPNISRNKILIDYSTLKYFEEYIDPA